MAARENQGYLIAVIILVLLVLVLGLLTFFGWSKANEYSEGKTKAEADLKVETKVSLAHQIEAEILRAYVGNLGESIAEVATKRESAKRISNDSSLTGAQKSEIENIVTRLDDVQQTYESDMQQFIARTEDDQAEDLTWTGLVRNLISVTAKKHNDVAVANRQNEDYRLDYENRLKAQKQELDKTSMELAGKTEELTNEQKRNEIKEKQLTDALQAAENEINRASQENENSRQVMTKQINDLETANGTLETDNKTLKNRIATLTAENFDLADGQVMRVAGNNVYLNIGRADGLRSNMTFSVFDNSINNFEMNEQKAKIEVLGITGAHTARARITEENPVDPIKKGDNVVTPTWDPGHSVAIALAGFFDLDGDGHSDRQRLVRMIENNGGKVVAQTDEEGNVIGKIDSSTKYLVMGSTGTGLETNVNNAIRTLEAQGKKNTVQPIDLRKLLNWMGRHNRAMIVRDNNKGTSGGFRERTPSSQPSDGSSSR